MIHRVLLTDASIPVKTVACEAFVEVTPHIRFLVSQRVSFLLSLVLGNRSFLCYRSLQDRSNVVLPAVLSLAQEPEAPCCRCLAALLLAGLAE